MQVWGGGQRALRLSPEAAGGKPHAVAVLPEGLPPAKALAAGGTAGGVIFRMHDEEQVRAVMNVANLCMYVCVRARARGRGRNLPHARTTSRCALFA